MSNRLFVPPEYPLHSFLTTVREAAHELQRNVQAPDAMIGMSLISAITLACQCLIEVQLPIGVRRPVTQNVLSIGVSGERKSAVDRLVYQPFREADAKAVMSHIAAMEAYKVELDWWRTINNSIRRDIDSAFRRDEKMDEVKDKLLTHAKLKPKLPKLRVLLRNDLTPRAIMDALEGDRESIAIMTDDGESLFKSGAMANLGLLNRLWDSPSVLSLDRADHEHISAMNPRVSISIMTQEEVFNDYRDNRGRLAKDSGHWSRYLVGFPRTTKGTRWVKSDEPTWSYLPEFHDRIRELLAEHRQKLATGNAEFEVVEFSGDAKARWIQQANNTEAMIRPGEYLSDIDDLGSKTMEIIARLAASMHYFAGESGKITLDTLERAITIVGWHVDEYKRLFSPQFVVPQVQIDARAIIKHLQHRWRGFYSNSFVPKTEVLHNGPLRENGKMRLNSALDLLTAQGAVQIGRGPDPKDRKTYIYLMDGFFSNLIL